jgi:hypothetical protein
MSGRDSFDVVAEDIARSFYSVFQQYSSDADWMFSLSNLGGTWEDASDQRQAFMIAVVKKLLLLEKIVPGPQVISAGEKP